jgi:hypothetical protein
MASPFRCATVCSVVQTGSVVQSPLCNKMGGFGKMGGEAAARIALG